MMDVSLKIRNYLDIRYLIEKILIIVFLPFLIALFFVVFIYLKFVLRGDVIFKQKRQGLNLKPFIIYKFRTMNEQGIIVKKLEFLRKHRIDEIPQFYNILIGDMSIIGPRPDPYEYYGLIKSKYPEYDLRYSIKPGLTGLAQIKYKHTSSIDDAMIKFKYDIEYISNISPRLDIYILIKTIFVLFTSKGAA